MIVRKKRLVKDEAADKLKASGRSTQLDARMLVPKLDEVGAAYSQEDRAEQRSIRTKMGAVFIQAFCDLHAQPPEKQLEANERVSAAGVEATASWLFSSLTGSEISSGMDSRRLHRLHSALEENGFTPRRTGSSKDSLEEIRAQPPRPWLAALYLTRQALLDPFMMTAERTRVFLENLSRNEPSELGAHLAGKI